MALVYFFYLAVGAIFLTCFFFLCSNVSKIKKSIVSDYDKYLFYKEIGDKEKAFYYLQRDFIFVVRKYQATYDMVTHYQRFKNLGKGIPDFKEFEIYKDKEEK